MLTAGLMLAWFAISFLPVFFARELSGWIFFGWPFPFYMSAQGSLILFVVIIWIYARRMDRIERECAATSGQND